MKKIYCKKCGEYLNPFGIEFSKDCLNCLINKRE